VIDRDEISAEIHALLSTLRKCDTQATAVQWMKRAYTTLEQCLEVVDRPVKSSIFLPSIPKLEVVQTIPPIDERELQARRERLQARSICETVVYPPAFQHPGLARAWTRKDTLRLESAARSNKIPPIQRRGR
jgi:hypothetical protein